MIDAAMPPACVAQAQAAVASRRGAWIDRAVKTIQAHNASLEEHNGRCGLCGHTAGILWEPPATPRGWVKRFLAARFPA